ncbi:hypothetical protein GQ43DRAFT_217537 [Delitschia confertaspora ATCC 74209]|uniref:Uncharacterized protein n=1 Tax=Delitschia confertaspora ATCC 74209 TaxID=1513339 RepID=A0A9P4MNL3_9PLEO|nr:hypothetical protein GQ43DRAFT_217537 [Delitschia confertaspora ATCC 74209]
MSSSAFMPPLPFLPSTGMLAILSISSSSYMSVSSSSSTLRLRVPVRALRVKSPSRMLSSSPAPALIVAAESDTKWLPMCVNAPSMVYRKGRYQGGTLYVERCLPRRARKFWEDVKLSRNDVAETGGR